MAQPPKRDRCRVTVFAVVVVVAGLGLTEVAQGPAEAAVTAVKGSACGYITNVGLFGGPQAKLGCAPQSGNVSAPATPTSLSPSVALPAAGSATAITAADPDGAQARYGPATIFGGIWPEDVASPTPSGPISVSTQGTPAGGTVTSSTDIGLNPSPPVVTCSTGFTPPCHDPGGFGPAPVWGDSLHVECSASATAVTGSATFKNAFIATATDSGGSPLPSATQAIPDNPPVNYTRSGVITNVGDIFTAVFNQQIVNSDGSLTVNAVHMYLFGPTAVGDMVKGQATCGTTPSAASGNDTVAPGCGILDVEPVAPDDPTPQVPRVELRGVFDAGGLQSITNVQSINGTVQIGNPDPNSFPYLKFTPGQTGPLAITATRKDESKPMTWSFDATDKAGNVTHSAQCPTDTPADTTSTTGGSGTTSTTGGSGTTSTTVDSSTTTTQPSGDVTVSPATVAPGGTIQVGSPGWTPASEVTVTLHSDPITLGTLTADSSGAVSGAFTIPSTTAAGAHTLELSGTGTDGAARTVTTALTVSGDIVTTTSSPSGATVSGSGLARTGMNILRFLMVAAFLFGLGAFLVSAGREGRWFERR